MKVIICMLWIYSTRCATQSVTLETTLGDIQGETQQVFGKEINVFLGIPFAKPPVGELRFKRPEEVEPWAGTLNATTYAPACPQVPQSYTDEMTPLTTIYTTASEISEDCLYLNIWAPKDANGAAVMVYIYGGSFTTGSARRAIINGQYLAAETGVIVVTIQYRLGFWGFFYLGREDAPGNVGLVDQYMALKWVHENIGSFGGDSSRIAIFGNSAGASSVALQATTTLDKYFSNAIIQSAADPYGAWAIQPKEVAFSVSKKYANDLGCTEETEDDILVCLKEISTAEILQAIGSAYFSLTVDEYFIETGYQNRWGNGDINFIIGTNEEEGFYFAVTRNKTLFFISNRPSWSKEELRLHISSNLALPPINDDSYNYMVKLFNDTKSLDRIGLSDAVFTHFAFYCPAKQISQDLSDSGSNVYMYMMKKKPSWTPFPSWFGATHADEIVFAFGRPLDPQLGYSAEDVDLSREMVHYWANLAKTGSVLLG